MIDVERWHEASTETQRLLLLELWFEGELRLPLGGDEYDAKWHSSINELEDAGLIAFDHNVDNDAGGFDQILYATDEGTEFLREYFKGDRDRELPPDEFGPDSQIDLAPTWMVTSVEDVLRAAQVETEQPYRQTIPARFGMQLLATMHSRRIGFIGDEPLPPVVLRVKRELISFGQSDLSGPFASTTG